MSWTIARCTWRADLLIQKIIRKFNYKVKIKVKVKVYYYYKTSTVNCYTTLYLKLWCCKF